MNDGSMEFRVMVTHEPFPWPVVLGLLCLVALVVILHGSICGFRAKRAGNDIERPRRRVFSAALLLLCLGSGVIIWQLAGMMNQILSWLNESNLSPASANEIIVVSVKHIVLLYAVLLALVVAVSAVGFSFSDRLGQSGRKERTPQPCAGG